MERRAVTKSPAGKVVVSHLHDQLRRERIPFPAPLRAPAARSARRSAGEPGGLDQSLEALGELRLLALRHVGGETHVVQHALVVQAKQQGAHELSLRGITEPTNDAVGGARLLDLEHAVAIATLIWQIDALGDDSIESAA